MTEDLRSLQTAIGDRYAIERELGAGGMATVYLAQDIRHHRRVAVKVLRPEIAASLGGARFTQEIEVAAQLQHPNILPLLDSGESAGVLYYVMPFVEGETLRDRLAHHGELPVNDAVRILCEVVDALGYAHAHGVVHRDIKPDNILLSGRHALIADFGVAKALSEATGRHQLTSAGIALGTPAYMAPEQAAADPHIDHRVDIYAVGVLAYELLTGRPPFVGLTPHEVLAAHITREPEPIDRLRPGLPRVLSQIVARCLAKRPADRWQTAEELLAQLEPLQSQSGGTEPALRAGAPPSRQRPIMIGVAAGVVLLALVAAMLIPRRRGDSVMLGRATQLTFEPGLEIEPSFSPDGRLVAYAAGPTDAMRLFVRQPGARAVPIAPDSGPSQRRPLWSPDGTQILFLRGTDLAIMPSLGGVPRTIVRGTTARPVTSAAWAHDGRRIAYVIGDTMYTSSAEGAGARAVTVYPDFFALSWSPDDRYIAMAAGNAFFATGAGQWFGNVGPSEILLVPSAGGKPVAVTDRVSLNVSPVWMPDGRHLLFVSNREGPRDIYSVRVNGAGRADGVPTRVTTGLGAHSIALTPDGQRIAYSVFAARSNIWSIAIPSRTPVSASLATRVTTGNQLIETLGISWDGKRLYYDSDRSGNSDIYRMTLPAGEPTQFTTDSADEFAAEESPDGRWVAFHSLHFGTRDILVVPAEGGPAQRITSDPAEERGPQWSPDGNSLSYWINDGGDRNGIYVISRSDGGWGSPRHLTSQERGSSGWLPTGRTLLVFSRVGQDIWTISADSGALRLLYSPRPGSTDPPARSVRAARDGRHIYFKSSDRSGFASFWELPVTGGKPRLLVRFDDPSRPSSRTEFATDGKRLYFTIDDRQSDVYLAKMMPAQ